jgi:hypothetical protein
MRLLHERDLELTQEQRTLAPRNKHGECSRTILGNMDMPIAITGWISCSAQISDHRAHNTGWYSESYGEVHATEDEERTFAFLKELIPLGMISIPIPIGGTSFISL